jgi:hypothetical protein
VGPAVFWGVFTALGMVQPGYNPFRYEFSLLVLGAHGWSQTANFVAFGLLVVAFKGGLQRAIAPGRRWGPILILALAFGAGFVLLAIFPTDPPGARTLHGLVHLVTVAALVLLFPAACWVVARALGRHTAWHGHAWFTMAAGALTLALLMAWGGAWRALHPWLGLYERAVFAVPSVWMEVTGIHLMRVPQADQDEPGDV